MSTEAQATKGPPRPSEVLAKVEQDLRDLWSVPAKSGETPKNRVTTMNLVIVAAQEVADRYVNVIDEVTKSVPARAILLALTPEAKAASLAADVTAVCTLDGEKKVTCSERIRFDAAGELTDRMGNAVQAFLLPDLPTVLVWLGRVRVDDPVFSTLAGEAARVILDTEYTSVQSLVNLVRWTRSERGRPGVADLSWTRIGAWRELAARFFDEENALPFAGTVKSLTLQQVGEGTGPIGSEAALFLGWIATRLGWKGRTVGGALRFESAQRTPIDVKVARVAGPPGVAPLALAHVGIVAEHQGKALRGTITRELGTGLEGSTRDADMLLWQRSIGNEPLVERRVRMGANKGARLLDVTLRRPPTDAALLEAASFAELIADSLAAGLP